MIIFLLFEAKHSGFIDVCVRARVWGSTCFRVYVRMGVEIHDPAELKTHALSQPERG